MIIYVSTVMTFSVLAFALQVRSYYKWHRHKEEKVDIRMGCKQPQMQPL